MGGCCDGWSGFGWVAATLVSAVVVWGLGWGGDDRVWCVRNVPWLGILEFYSREFGFVPVVRVYG